MKLIQLVLLILLFFFYIEYEYLQGDKKEKFKNSYEIEPPHLNNVSSSSHIEVPLKSFKVTPPSLCNDETTTVNIDRKGKENLDLKKKTFLKKSAPESNEMLKQNPILKKINWDKNILESLVSIYKKIYFGV